MDKNIKISICVPVHNMERSEYFLERCLDSILAQTFSDFEVVVTDNSEDDRLKKLCQKYGMNIRWSRNPRKGMAQNTNEALKLARGELVKILYMDDYFTDKDSLQDIVDAFRGHWLVSGCLHNDGSKVGRVHRPKFTKDILTGNNKIGSPSVLTMKNGAAFFDESMTWLLDCDLYWKLSQKYGEPTYLNTNNVVIGVGSHQVTNLLTNKQKEDEEKYLSKKYA